MQWTSEENNPRWGLAVRPGPAGAAGIPHGHGRELARLVVNCPGPPVWLFSRHTRPAGGVCVCAHAGHTRQPGRARARGPWIQSSDRMEPAGESVPTSPLLKGPCKYQGSTLTVTRPQQETQGRHRMVLSVSVASSTQAIRKALKKYELKPGWRMG